MRAHGTPIERRYRLRGSSTRPPARARARSTCATPDTSPPGDVAAGACHRVVGEHDVAERSDSSTFVSARIDIGQ